MFNKNSNVTYGIIGLGRFGMALAKELANSGAELLAIEADEEKVGEIREYTENAFVLQNLDKKTLLRTGIQNCDVAVVCIGEHIDVSILTTLNLVSMGIPKVIAKANSEEHGQILEKLGAEVVYPERDMALRLGYRLEASKVLDFVKLSKKINISKLYVPEFAIGQTVVEADLRGRFGVNIIAIENNGKVIDHVKPDYKFRKDDIIFLSGSKEGIMNLDEHIEKTSH